MVNVLPYPIGSRVLYRGGDFFIYNIHKYDATYDLIHVKGGVHCHMVEHSEIQMMFPAATSCDWNKMLAALG
jgi:hypothetical protein